MSLKPEWMDLPVIGRWAVGKHGVSLLAPIDTSTAHAEQRRRARELAKAMGFRGAISDQHAARIITVLGEHVPGLRCRSPDETIEVPAVDWTPARAGRPSLLAKDTDGETLRLGVARFKDREARAGRRSSDRNALEDLREKWSSGALFADGPPPALSTLQHMLRKARDEYEASLA